MSNLTPLNGTKTHPLTAHAYEALEALLDGPIPCRGREVNAGVQNRLEREDLAVTVMLPNPYETSRRREPTIAHLKITEAGRAALASHRK